MPEKIKILYLQSTAEIGGADVSLLRIVQKLDKTRFEPHVIFPAESPMRAELERAGCAITVMPEMLKLTTRKGRAYLVFYFLHYPLVVLKLAAFIRRRGISVVHTNNIHNLYGFPAAALGGARHVWHIREIVFQSGFVRRAEVFLASHFGGTVIVTSDAVAEMFRKKDGGFPENMTKISNAVDMEVFHPRHSGEKVRKALNFSSETPVAGVVCRLDPWKGVDVFLHAAAICKSRFPSARYVVAGGAIAGRETYAQELWDLATRLGLADAVTFTGWRYGPEWLPELHAALDVLVLPSSEPEPFGLVVIEAMASGKPVIATRHGGPVEICLDRETALLVPPRDPEKMAEAMLEIFRDPAKAREMGAAGRKRAEKFYDRAEQIRKLEDLYQRLAVK